MGGLAWSPYPLAPKRAHPARAERQRRARLASAGFGPHNKPDRLEHQSSLALGDPDLCLGPGVELQEVRLDAVAENHAVLRHL